MISTTNHSEPQQKVNGAGNQILTGKDSGENQFTLPAVPAYPLDTFSGANNHVQKKSLPSQGSGTDFRVGTGPIALPAVNPYSNSFEDIQFVGLPIQKAKLPNHPYVTDKKEQSFKVGTGFGKDTTGSIIEEMIGEKPKSDDSRGALKKEIKTAIEELTTSIGNRDEELNRSGDTAINEKIRKAHEDRVALERQWKQQLEIKYSDLDKVRAANQKSDLQAGFRGTVKNPTPTIKDIDKLSGYALAASKPMNIAGSGAAASSATAFNATGNSTNTKSNENDRLNRVNATSSTSVAFGLGQGGSAASIGARQPGSSVRPIPSSTSGGSATNKTNSGNLSSTGGGPQSKAKSAQSNSNASAAAAKPKNWEGHS